MRDSGVPDLAPHRGLKNRHIQFIAIGGAIGAGLFLGSGAAIAAGGPATLLAYAICGIFVFLMARALGELMLQASASVPFVSCLAQDLPPILGFVTGWTYWVNWVIVGAVELTAAGLFIRYWFPGLPQWGTVGALALAIIAINLRNVKFFGEAEFWLALVKIVAILALVGLGLMILLVPTLLFVPGAGIGNLVEHGGFFPTGIGGIIHMLPATLFAFGGVEVVALTAREAENPLRSLPRAINGVILRILIFYIATMFVLMAVTPWTSYSAAESPFVAFFARIGIPTAAGIVNFIVLTAVLSAANTGLFATGRMLSGLAREGFAPRPLMALDSHGIPMRGICASGMCLLLVVLVNWFIPERAFAVLMGATGYFLLWVWGAVMIAHRNMRRRSGAAGPFALPLYPLTTWLTIGFVAFALMLSMSNLANLLSTLGAGLWFSAAAAVGLSRRWRTTCGGSED